MNGFTDKCPRHGQHAAWNCPACDAETTPPPEHWRDQLTLTRRTRPKTRPEPTHDLADVRARADAEEAQA